MGDYETSNDFPNNHEPRFSVVIPVYNSEQTIYQAIERVCKTFESEKISYEVVAVNDGSKDDSWGELVEICDSLPNVIAINLIRNFGQHNANLCGFNHSKGEYIITLDDDLQNPPEEIHKLIAKSEEGHDLVIGRFKTKKHSLGRRLGSKIVNRINEKIFSKPPDLVMTNFRLIHRSVIDRISSFRGTDPYIPGLVIAYSGSPANVEVIHESREIGKSNYGIREISKLVLSMLFNYSIYPLRFMVASGFIVSMSGFTLGTALILRNVTGNTSVPGWTSTVTLISFFSAFIILLLGVLGEYIIYITRSISQPSPYIVKEIRKSEK